MTYLDDLAKLARIAGGLMLLGLVFLLANLVLDQLRKVIAGAAGAAGGGHGRDNTK